MKFLTTFICLISFYGFSQPKLAHFTINHVDDFEDEQFSFTQKWSYPEGVYLSQYGQLICDGLCPEGAENYINEQGKIGPQSLEKYYEIVDTTHYFHTFFSNSNAPEFAGSNFISAVRHLDGSILCESANNVATHSSLHLKLDGTNLIAWIEVNSINPSIGRKKLQCISANFNLSDRAYEKGFLKAEFNLLFANTIHPENGDIYWNGKICTKIQ